MTLSLPITLALSLWLGDPPKLADLEFSMAVEESVMAERDSLAMLPEPHAGLIAKLGARHWRDRDDASSELFRLSVVGSRQWLWWGRRSHDREVALRCNNIVRRLNPCGSCGGTGISRHYREDTCFDCHGVGSAWEWTAWD